MYYERYTYLWVYIDFSFKFVIDALFDNSYSAWLISKDLCHLHDHSHLKLISSLRRWTSLALALISTRSSALAFNSRWSCDHPGVVKTLHFWPRVLIDLRFTLTIQTVKNFRRLLNFIWLLVIIVFFMFKVRLSSLTNITHRRF